MSVRCCCRGGFVLEIRISANALVLQRLLSEARTVWSRSRVEVSTGTVGFGNRRHVDQSSSVGVPRAQSFSSRGSCCLQSILPCASRERRQRMSRVTFSLAVFEPLHQRDRAKLHQALQAATASLRQRTFDTPATNSSCKSFFAAVFEEAEPPRWLPCAAAKPHHRTLPFLSERATWL